MHLGGCNSRQAHSTAPCFLHGTWTEPGAQRPLWPYNNFFFSRDIKAKVWGNDGNGRREIPTLVQGHGVEKKRERNSLTQSVIYIL